MMLSVLKKLSLLLVFSLYATQLIADNLINRENQLKAVYLVHFASLTRWPETTDLAQTFTICLYGQALLKPYLKELAEEPINGKHLEIKQIFTLNNKNQCRMIYFDSIEPIWLNVGKIDIYPYTLLVGNDREFIIQGGSISFTIVQNKIKIIINLAQVRQSGLDISSKLLRIAEIIDLNSKLQLLANNLE